jgi:putative ABC transport system permease protein
VHGASVPELVYMLNKDYVKWVGIAFLIASPVGYYFMNNWLSDFAYKTNLDWTVFLLSGFFALSVALFTINWQIWRTTTRNPVEVLKYE